MSCDALYSAFYLQQIQNSCYFEKTGTDLFRVVKNCELHATVFVALVTAQMPARKALLAHWLQAAPVVAHHALCLFSAFIASSNCSNILFISNVHHMLDSLV